MIVHEIEVGIIVWLGVLAAIVVFLYYSGTRR